MKHIAVDGKAVRSAPRNTFSGVLHLVSAWAAENRLILGRQAVVDGSHEVAAIPELLRVLDLEGALVKAGVTPSDVLASVWADGVFTWPPRRWNNSRRACGNC